MHIYQRKCIWLLLLPALMSACFAMKQPGKKTAFYTLEYDLPPLPDFKPLPVVLAVERFAVAPTYNSNQIIYRDNAFRRDAYTYHKWRNNPGDLVSTFLGRDLQQSGLFKAVLSSDSLLPATYVVEGAVNEFFEWDLDKTWKAVLTLTITLMASDAPNAGRMILLQKTYRAQKMCKHKNPQALAEAMSLAMKGLSLEIIRDIHSQLAVAGR